MLIGYTYDDGGRADAGFKGDTGDCAVRAIAILTGIPYADVYRRMAACMRLAGYGSSGNAYRQRPRRGLKPAISARDLQNLVKTSYGLRRVKLGRGPKPTYSEAWALHGDCLVGTAKHVSAIVDGNLRDTFDGRFYDGILYGGTARDQRKAQSIWIPARLECRTILTPEFDPSALIPPPKRRPHSQRANPIPEHHHRSALPPSRHAREERDTGSRQRQGPRRRRTMQRHWTEHPTAT